MTGSRDTALLRLAGCSRSRWRWSPGWSRSSPRAWSRCCPATSPTPPGCPAPTSRHAPRAAGCCSASLLFVLGFSFVFVALGTLSGALGDWLFEYQRQITRRARRASRSCSAWRSSGVVPWLQRDVRVHRVPAVGLAAAPLLGVLFGARLDAVHRPDPRRGARRSRSTRAPPAAARCSASPTRLGLGLPFILAGLAYRRMLGAVAWVRRHQVWVTRLGGADAGRWSALLLVTGWWDQLVADLPRLVVAGFEVERLMRRTTDAPTSGPSSASAPRRRRRRPAGAEPGRARCAGPGASSPRCAPRWSCCSCSRWPRSRVGRPAGERRLAAGLAAGRTTHPTLTPVYERLGLFASTARRGSPRSTSC